MDEEEVIAHILRATKQLDILVAVSRVCIDYDQRRCSAEVAIAHITDLIKGKREA
jgi:hypothetical protein